jgi:hypothetical protein
VFETTVAAFGGTLLAIGVWLAAIRLGQPKLAAPNLQRQNERLHDQLMSVYASQAKWLEYLRELEKARQGRAEKLDIEATQRQTEDIRTAPPLDAPLAIEPQPIRIEAPAHGQV